ncbi:MAG: Xaa-Pro peptidase family protein [candidate division WOR-3 bacterium]
MNVRTERLKNYLRDKNLDALIVTSGHNLTYLCGYTGSNGMLLVFRQGQPIFYTDFRYQEQVKSEVKGCRIKIWDRNLIDNFPVEDLRGVSSLGFEANHLTYRNFLNLKKQLKGQIKLIPQDNIIEHLRQIKDPTELSLIRKAVKYTDQIFREILSLIKPGISEKDLSSEINYRFMKLGELSFPTIVAFGENSSKPHAVPTIRKLRKNDVILIDMGLRYQNYCADMTRTVFFGKATRRFKEIYQIVLDAQLKAIEMVQDGVLAKDVDIGARKIIDESGYGKYFGHGLGHGVGLAVHELPTVSSKSQDTLRTNMTISVEPGIYLPNEFGIRIEDIVAVTKNRCEILTKSSKELVEL